MPIPLFTHTFCSLTQLDILCSSLHVFVVVSSFHSWKNPFLVLFSEWAEENHDLRVFKACFPFPHTTRSCCAIFPHVLCISSSFHGRENPFLCCLVNGQQRSTFWVFRKVVFSPVIPNNVCCNHFWFPGCFSPFYQSIFLVANPFLVMLSGWDNRSMF